jgi:hypothetical protein
MKARIRENNSLIIIAETDFEEEYLKRYSSQDLNKAWLKHGLGVADLIGLVIETVPMALEDTI